MKHIRFLLLSLCLFLCACRPESRTSSEFVLGTVCTLTVYGRSGGEPFRAVFARLRELEDIFSANREGTDLDLVNRNAGIMPIRVRPEFILVLEKALDYAELSGGAFDPALGPLVKLWGIGGDNPHLPEAAGLAAVLAGLKGVNRERDIEIDREASTVFLRIPGMMLDLGAIAKGFAADQAALILEKAGIKAAVIDLGGNILAYGKKPFPGLFRRPGGKNAWRIGIQDPRDTRGSYIGVLETPEKSVVTSGVYERYFTEGGKRYHHILSTETGYPVENGLLSVTVVAKHSIDADALSTAVFALGWEKGSALLEKAGAEGIFIFENGSVRISGGLRESFSLAENSDYFDLQETN